MDYRDAKTFFSKTYLTQGLTQLVIDVVRRLAGVGTYRGHWTRWTGTGPSGERLFYATSPKSSASFEFSGDRVTCIHKVGPDCGVAEVLIDGQPAHVSEIDTYAPQVDWNQRTKLAVDLVPGKHVVTVRVAARKNPASSNCFVQIVGFTTECNNTESTTEGEEKQ